MFKFKVIPESGDPLEVEATSRDVFVWEKVGRGRSVSALEDNPTMSAFYELAHIACRRQQLTTDGLEGFAAANDLEVDPGVRCEDEACPCVDHDDQGEPDPTRPAR